MSEHWSIVSSTLLPSEGSESASTLQRKNLLEQFKERLEPSVAGPTIVNDGSIFMALGVWYEQTLVHSFFQHWLRQSVQQCRVLCCSELS